MDGAGEDFCNDDMIAMLKYSNHFYSHPLRVSKFVKKVACKKLLDEHKTRKLCYSHVRLNMQGLRDHFQRNANR
jgi:hypothetical protein